MDQYIGTKIVHAFPHQQAGKDGYAVHYADGYTSWSPKDVFEEAYRRSDGMTFGLALEAMRKGLSVTRAPWGAAGVFVYRVPAAAYPVQTGAAKAHFGEESMVPYLAYLAIKRADDTVCVFVPGMDSLLADDWQIFTPPLNQAGA
jgi:hypothetical protein